MRFRTMLRHFREALRSFWRNGWMTFASISTITISLLILGVFVLLNFNIEAWTKGMEREVEIRAFLKMETTDSEITRLEARLAKLPEVSEVIFIPREEGLIQLKETFGEQGLLFEGLEEDNPLPHAFLLRTKNPQETPKVAKVVEQFEAVDKVRYGKGTVERLFSITNAVRNVGLFFIVGLAFTAMFLIANTIKLTILSKRNEIEVMKLVGATNSFIRWPFFIEGSLLGLLGAIIPLGILMFGYKYLATYLANDVEQSFIRLIPFEPILPKLTYLLLGIGIFIGIWGSITSIRKFLRV